MGVPRVAIARVEQVEDFAREIRLADLVEIARIAAPNQIIGPALSSRDIGADRFGCRVEEGVDVAAEPDVLTDELVLDEEFEAELDLSDSDDLPPLGGGESKDNRSEAMI